MWHSKRFSLFLGIWQILFIALNNCLRVLKRTFHCPWNYKMMSFIGAGLYFYFFSNPSFNRSGHFLILETFSFGFYDNIHSRFSFFSLVTIPHLPILALLYVRFSQHSIRAPPLLYLWSLSMWPIAINTIYRLTNLKSLDLVFDIFTKL